MTVSIIAAVAANGVIGVDNALPWHIPADLRRFKSLTMGHHMIMGRRTYESIGRPLPGRVSIIVSRNLGYVVVGCHVVHSFASAIELAEEDSEVFIIGGGELYTVALGIADRLYLTEIDREVDGDTRFPAIDRPSWRKVEEVIPAEAEASPWPFRFVTYERRGVRPPGTH